MKYQLIDITNPDTVIGESGEIATLWKVLDNQHFMLKPSLVIVRDGEVVAGPASLLDKMIANKAFKVSEVASII